MIYDKNITIFFRGSDASARVASSTQSSLSKKIHEIVHIEFINLEKRNLKKYLASTAVHIAYLWHDEELASDFIKENYPNIEIRTFSNKDSVKYKETYLGGKREYLLSERITNDIRKTFGDIEKWIIKVDLNNNLIEKISIPIMDYKNLYNGRQLFDSRQEALIFYIDKTEKDLHYATKRVSDLKNLLKRLNKSASLLK